jgi:tetratricopeptide (TPR) repeat protein
LRIGGADAKLHVNMGNIEMNAGRLNEAEAAYNRALEADGSMVKAHIGLSRIALLRRNPNRADYYVRQALELEPLYPAVYWELARALRAEGKPAQAAQALEKGVSYSEGRTAVRLLRALAQIYEIAGDQAAAKDALDRARMQAERSQSSVDLALIDAQMDAYDGLDDLS